MIRSGIAVAQPKTNLRYPLAVSLEVTGTFRRWMFEPTVGLQAIVRNLG